METIGQQLREARERKKLSLETAAQGTKIKGEYLAALEADQFDRIEAPVYVRGFLRIYSQYLGLDSKPLVNQFANLKSAEAAASAEPPKPITPRPIGKTSTSVLPEAQTPLSPSLLFALLGIVFGVLVVIWGIWAVLAGSGQSKSEPKPADTPAVSAAPAKATADAYLKPKGVGPALIIEPPRAPAHTLTIRADEPCEVTVTVDGAVLFRGNMPRNEVRKFDASRSIRIKVNDGNAIHAWYDQKDLGKLGRRREMIDRQF
ncbi:MAG: helix-turn-helix domain-containing protein [Verrucomicrobia bacterium]|nr:helix-turn-helix domain-containing protein [Verrucomicrobiota bacterium]